MRIEILDEAQEDLIQGFHFYEDLRRELTMGYCVICDRYHDLDMGCFDGTGQALRDIGIPRPRTQHTKGRSTEARWQRVVLYVFVGTILILALWWLLRAAP